MKFCFHCFFFDTMTRENISVKFLIHLVGERPALWDKTSDDYRDRALKETSWREICTYVNENFHSLAPKAREEFTRMISKKWGHIRDSWVKSMKYGYDEVTKEPPKPYIYHNELKFMQKILKCKSPCYNINKLHLTSRHFEEFYRDQNETRNSNGASREPNNNEEDESDAAVDDLNVDFYKQEPNTTNNNSEPKVNIVNKAEDVDDIDDWHLEDTELMPITEERNNKQSAKIKKKRQSIFIGSRDDDEYEDCKAMKPSVLRPTVPPVESPQLRYIRLRQSLYENRHWNFLKGILPTVNDLDDDHALQFQSGVIALLQKLRESQKQKSTIKTNRLPSHSLYKTRGRKSKTSCDDDDDWPTHKRRKSARHISDPIAPDDKNLETELSSDN